MIKQLRIFLGGIVADLEYALYPWKDENDTPPENIIAKYNLPEKSFDEQLNYDWIKSHDEKIDRLQKEMIWVQSQLTKNG